MPQHSPHPSVGPWDDLTRLLARKIVISAERAPGLFAPLEERLAARRKLASLVVKTAHSVIDSIDQNPVRKRVVQERWTIQDHAPYITGEFSPMLPTPVVPCDDAAIERVAVWLFARSFIPQLTVEQVQPLWDVTPNSTLEATREAARVMFRIAAGETP